MCMTILTSLDNPANRVCQSRKISTKSYTEFVAQNSLCHAEKFRHLSPLFFISSYYYCVLCYTIKCFQIRPTRQRDRVHNRVHNIMRRSPARNQYMKIWLSFRIEHIHLRVICTPIHTYPSESRYSSSHSTAVVCRFFSSSLSSSRLSSAGYRSGTAC